MEPNRRVDLAVLENMINAINEDAEEYVNMEILVGKCKDGNLIIGDRPFLEEMVDGYNFLPLSCYFFIASRKTKISSMFSYIDADEKMIHLINRSVAENSSNWIASNNKNPWKEYADIEVKFIRENEPYYKQMKFLKTGNI